jgi:hypothetical protein
MKTQSKIIFAGVMAAALIAIVMVIVILRLDDKPGIGPDGRLVEELNKQAEDLQKEYAVSKDYHIFGKLDVAFNELGRKAGQGDEQALQTLYAALGYEYLNRPATGALGTAAAAGNDKALDILLEPGKNSLIRPDSLVSALYAAAQKGNPRVIKFLSEVTANKSVPGLWFMAASELAKPAGQGNEEAIKGLINLLASEDPRIQAQVKSGLTQAAAGGNARAQEAVKKMNW